MKIIKATTASLALLVLITSFQNCGKAQFSSDQATEFSSTVSTSFSNTIPSSPAPSGSSESNTIAPITPSSIAEDIEPNMFASSPELATMMARNSTGDKEFGVARCYADIPIGIYKSIGYGAFYPGSLKACLNYSFQLKNNNPKIKNIVYYMFLKGKKTAIASSSVTESTLNRLGAECTFQEKDQAGNPGVNIFAQSIPESESYCRDWCRMKRDALKSNNASCVLRTYELLKTDLTANESKRKISY